MHRASTTSEISSLHAIDFLSYEITAIQKVIFRISLINEDKFLLTVENNGHKLIISDHELTKCIKG